MKIPKGNKNRKSKGSQHNCPKKNDKKVNNELQNTTQKTKNRGIQKRESYCIKLKHTSTNRRQYR